ncbi:DUF1552 domain-containing protein [Stratiformator vulcanicus]|uniref:DUF1552 domain-containing protein n=1 Tax=Stratiformator vulcanicus TaxID=2527980 RepID=A0A517QZQ6_9PLAN|nr:DUF1552 domain-containing protein [Stratiformator vulcanicus]QDT37137.1 hypothetical protein Pan189_15050 [Stratiformator vulcanicus]
MLHSPLSRRAVLRGVGGTLALPMLEAMTPITAVAAGQSGGDPVRSVFIGVEGGIWTGEDGFFPYRDGENVERANKWGKNGILPGGFVADTGPDFRLTSTLEPLAPVKDRLLVLSGLKHANDGIPNSVVNGHGQDLGTLLTGANISGTPGVSLKNRMSLDQYMASKIGDRTRYSSLEVVVGGGSYNTREATGLGYMGFLSYDADGNVCPVEGDPAALFDRLFTDGNAEQQAEREANRRKRRSILDSLRQDLNRLGSKVAPEDRRKLDEYATSIREIEKRVARQKEWENVPIDLPKGTKRPEPSKGRGGYGGDGAGRVEEMRLMLDLVALALQTDVTRIVTLRLGGYFGSFKFLGFPEDPHGVYAHNGGDPKKFAGARAIDRMHIEQLSYFLQKLDGIQESSGSVLDNSLVFYGAGLTNGPNGRRGRKEVTYDAHGQQNCPILMAGKAGGNLSTGRHVTFDDGTPLSNLYVNVMESMGMPDENFADSNGPLSGLA